MKYVQINTVPNGSTGSVMFHTQAEREALGDECWAMWGRGRSAQNDHEFDFGTNIGVYLDVARTRLDDRAGFHSKAATRRLLAKLDEIDPDVVHLHNLHGYYLNIEMLFHWLKERNQRTIWTLHDCWAFTGHCSHFTYVGCDKWKTGCVNCPQKREYPKSVLRDASKQNYAYKQRVFTQLPAERLTLITPSQWLADLISKSYLAKYQVEVRRNEVDRSVFKPTPSDFRERYGIGNRFMVLGVASPWTKRKGLGDFIRLAQDLDDGCVVVLVGLTKQQSKRIPKRIVAIPRIESKTDLAKLYSSADIFLNPSVEESFGMTVSEARACGTAVLVHCGTACVEAACIEVPGSSVFLANGTYESLLKTVNDAKRTLMDE